MHRSWASAAGRARPISRASLVCAPQSGSTVCATAITSASTKAKCPSSTIMGNWSLCGPPFAGLLQRRGDFRWHVFLVMLGQHGRGRETAIGSERSFDHHALIFTKEIGQHAAIDDSKRVLLVGNAEAHVLAILAHAALLDEPAEAEVVTRRLRARQ